jgi:hypothetical protein
MPGPSSDGEFIDSFPRAAWPLAVRTLLALVTPREQVGNDYAVELVQRSAAVWLRDASPTLK